MSNSCKWLAWNDCQFVNTTDNVWWSFQDPKAPGWSNLPIRGGDTEREIDEIIERNYGRKPYMGKSYSEMMRRMPLRATFDQVLQKKSQFEKPYLEDEEYPEMQHWVPEFPPMNWAEPGPFGPNPTLPPVDPSDLERGWLCSLTCYGDIGRCGSKGCGGEVFGECRAGLVAVGSTGNWHVTGSPLLKAIKGRDTPSFGGEQFGLDAIEIYPDWEKIEITTTSGWGEYGWKRADYKVTYEDSDGNICHGNVWVSCCTTCECPASLAYSSGNPTTIGQSAEAVITVDAGCGPYTWNVTGTDFSFREYVTENATNVLIAGASACGTAVIEVSDSCGSVTGDVRCTTGTWALKVGTISSVGCSPWCSIASGVDPYEYVVGDQKWEMSMAGNIECYGAGPCPCTPANTWSSGAVPAPPCGDPIACCDEAGCNDCGANTTSLWPSFRYYEWECA